ncbi:MAG: leucine-rich repeat protein [Prevotella sp.]|nr:leucine-rich repeat protein [Prevotella sp.]
MATLAFAADFQIEGFVYTVTDDVEHTVALTGWDEDFYYSISSPTNPSIGFGDDEEEEGPVDVIIPWQVLYNGINYRVTAIGEDAFANCETLHSVTIPNSIESIGERAFAGCAALTMVKVQWINPLPISESVFEGINYEAATLYVLSGYAAAYQAADVWKNFGTITTYYDTDVNMWFKDPQAKAICVANWDTNGDGELSYREAQAVTDLAAAFTGDTNVTSFTELRSFSGLATVGPAAFKGCTALSEVTLPPYATVIEEEGFAGCTALQTINFQTPLTTIEAYAFAGCTTLPKVTLPANLVTIGAHAFDGCTAITTFTIPAKVASIGAGAFANCTSNKTFTVNSSNKVYATNSTKVYITDKAEKRMVVAFAVGATNRNISFATTVNEVCPSAFEGDQNIVSVNLTNIETVGNDAFANCSLLTSLSIPACVTSIGERICNESNAITDVYSDNLEPYGINDNNFTTTVYENATLHVPAEARETYLSLEGWRNFAYVPRPESVYCDSLTINQGETESLVICLANDKGKEYIGFEFELVLPEGVGLVPQGNSYAYELSDRNPSGMVAAFDNSGDNHYLVVGTSIFGRPILETDGPVITLMLQADPLVQPGVYPCQICNIKLSGKNTEDVTLPDFSFNIKVDGEEFFELGDVNHDGAVNITDVMLTADAILGMASDSFNRKEADVNNDGNVDITDVMSIVSLVLEGKLPNSGGGDDPNPGGGDDPNPGGGDDPNPGGGDDPNPGGGDDPNPGGGDDPNPGGGDDPNPGGGDDPNPGGGDDPNPGGGDDPNPGGGDDPNPGGGDDPNPGGGDDPNPGGGDDPNPGGGDDPNPGGGDDPNNGGDDPNNGGDDPNNGGDDPNNGGDDPNNNP